MLKTGKPEMVILQVENGRNDKDEITRKQDNERTGWMMSSFVEDYKQ